MEVSLSKSEKIHPLPSYDVGLDPLRLSICFSFFLSSLSFCLSLSLSHLVSLSILYIYLYISIYPYVLLLLSFSLSSLSLPFSSISLFLSLSPIFYLHNLSLSFSVFTPFMIHCTVITILLMYPGDCAASVLG